MRMFTGDLEPDLVITLSDKTGDALDATAADIRIIGTQDGVLVFDRAPTTAVVDGATTVLTMAWQAGDTDAYGRMVIEVEVEWPGNRLQTFRPEEHVDIAADYDLSATP